MLKRSRLVGTMFLLLSLSIVGVSAYVYEQAQQTVTQTIKEIATLTLQNSALGNIEEGETRNYTKNELSSLGNAISIATTKASVYLYLDSDLDSLASSYETFDVVVKYATVPAGSSRSSGETACTLSLTSPDYSSISLDAAGVWSFDYEITTTAKRVSSDVSGTVTITVSAENA